MTLYGYLNGEILAFGILASLANMVGNLTLVYRLWIVLGDSKSRVWLWIPTATTIIGAGMTIRRILNVIG